MGTGAVQEKIHTHHMEGHWKLLGAGVLTSQILDAKYEAKLKFPGGTGVQNKTNPSVGGSMDIFWNCAMQYFVMTSDWSAKPLLLLIQGLVPFPRP